MIGQGLRRNKRRRTSGGGHGPLALIPMIDMLMIIVVYLLVHTADMEILPNSKNITIPMSSSEQTEFQEHHDSHVEFRAEAARNDRRDGDARHAVRERRAGAVGGRTRRRS